MSSDRVLIVRVKTLSSKKLPKCTSETVKKLDRFKENKSIFEHKKQPGFYCF
jgi:hypothetical protein